MSLPSLLATALVNMGVFPVEQDAQLLFEMFADDFMCEAVLQEVTEVFGSKLDDESKLSAIMLIVRLLRSVLASLGDTDSSGYPQYLWMPAAPDSGLPPVLDQNGLARWMHDSLSLKIFFKENFSKCIFTSEVPLKKWKHFRSRHVKDLPQQSQLEIERGLKFLWLDRLLAHLIPFAASIPEMAKVRLSDDPIQEYRDLFGKLRWRSIRIYTVHLESMLKAPKFQIPWNELRVRILLQQCRYDELAPSKVSGFWGTLKSLGAKLGMLSPDSIASLKQKRDAVTDVLVDKVFKPTKKAVVPPVSIMSKLETAIRSKRDACGSLLPAGLHFYATMLRFSCGASPRFNDAQHTALTSFAFTSSTVEAFPWQTKTVSKGCQAKPTVLIAPTHCFSPGSNWSESLQAWIQVLLKEGDPAKMDFCFPELTSDFQGFILRPVDFDRGLKIVKELLFRLEVNSKFLQEGTWHSFRVLMAELAFLALVPGHLRKYIGNWAKDTTADVYTREKRAVVAKIYAQVIPYINELDQTCPGRQVRIDLAHSEWDDTHRESQRLLADCVKLGSPLKQRKLEYDSPKEASANSSLVTPPVDLGDACGSPTLGVSSGTLDSNLPLGSPDDEGLVSDLLEPPSKEKVLVPATQVPPPLGPLHVYYRLAKSKVMTDSGFREPRHVVHLISFMTGVAIEVGRGWCPPTGSIEPLPASDYIAETGEYHLCTRCFCKYSLPDEWAYLPNSAVDVNAESDSDISSVSEGPSADSQSETEAFKPREIPGTLD